MNELLEGVYNNGEVIWLDLKWRVMSLLRRRIYSATLDDVIPQWVELMPQEGMIRFCDFRGTIVWYYEIDNGFVTLYKGWKSSLKNPLTESDVVNWVKQISDVDFYKTVDRKLS